MLVGLGFKMEELYKEQDFKNGLAFAVEDKPMLKQFKTFWAE